MHPHNAALYFLHFSIFFSFLLSFPFFRTVAKLRLPMHEGGANTHSRTLAEARLQKCMRRARGLQQRMQQQQQEDRPQQQDQEQTEKQDQPCPSPQGPPRYQHCLLSVSCDSRPPADLPCSAHTPG